MSMSRLFADNVLVRLLMGDTARADLMVSMTGVKLGEQLVVIGLGDPDLLATLGAKVGITGRACGVDDDPGRVATASRRAERAGVLVEVAHVPYAAPPYEPASFDLAVVRLGRTLATDHDVAEALEGARAVLRDGGRCVVIGDSAPSGVKSLVARGEPGPTSQQLVPQLVRIGFRAARVLAEREGLFFVEGVVRRGA
jgi:ubiquinone/menaquinone biosynthesis C-methylase UbiE